MCAALWSWPARQADKLKKKLFPVFPSGRKLVSQMVELFPELEDKVGIVTAQRGRLELMCMRSSPLVRHAVHRPQCVGLAF